MNPRAVKMMGARWSGDTQQVDAQKREECIHCVAEATGGEWCDCVLSVGHFVDRMHCRGSYYRVSPTTVMQEGERPMWAVLGSGKNEVCLCVRVPDDIALDLLRICDCLSKSERKILDKGGTK